VKVLLQRVSRADVRVDGSVTGRTGPGFLILVGIGRNDTEADLEWMAAKLVNLRVFPDEAGNMNRSILDTGGGILAVSQFTLHADCSRGRRPSFIGAGDPSTASAMFDLFVRRLRDLGPEVQTGVFGASMEVSLVNDGPVTIMLDSPSEASCRRQDRQP